jgi:hypothetical protein
MKVKNTWLALVLCLFAIGSVLQGCVTYFATEVDTGEKAYYDKPILTDEILAIGRPDDDLLKKMELSNTIAFIGRKNTYMLYLGGEELEQISKLKLNGKRITVSSEQKLFLKDKQVWGEIELYYRGDKEVSTEEMSELKKGGFTPYKDSDKRQNFETSIRIEGVVYPAIKMTDDQLSKLKVTRRFNLYNPRESSPPMLGKVLKVPVVATGVVTDVMLAPVYLGLGAAIVVIGVAFSIH